MRVDKGGKATLRGLVLLLLAWAPAASPENQPYRVLVVHSFRSSLPVTRDWQSGFARGFSSSPDLLVEMDSEAPDLSRVNDARYVRRLRDVYRAKYRGVWPHLIIATYTPAFEFLLDYGHALFPGVPILFCGADRHFVAARELAPHITGVTSHIDFTGTLELALNVHPDTRRVAVIVGSSELDQQLERGAQQAFRPFQSKLEFVWLRGKSLAELKRVLVDLPVHTVIFYLIQSQDHTGRVLAPAQVVNELSRVASAPIYGLWDTLIGYGIIGGRLVTLEQDAFRAAQMGLRILRGEAPAGIPVIDRTRNDAIFDGRELARWNISTNRLPANSRVLNRQLSVWDEHRTAVIGVGLLIGLQALLLAALLINRARLKRTQSALQESYERRSAAEADTRNVKERLDRLNRERNLGSMATGIAHEIGQPLIAIQNYVQAARRRLQDPGVETPKLNELFEKIRQQADRAGDIIKHVRSLVSTKQSELSALALPPVIRKVVLLVEPAFASHGCRIDFRPSADLPMVVTNGLEIQLVLVNLLQNALQSIASLEDPTRKVVRIAILRLNDEVVRISVADRGTGIPPELAQEIFEPLYSQREGSMGMGLNICRTIIAAHGGQIEYTPNPAGGAIFQFTLRVARQGRDERADRIDC